MKTEIFKSRRPTRTRRGCGRWPLAALLAASFLTAGNLMAMPEVETVTGGPWQGNPLYYGYVDGDTAAEAQFHTPYALALDTTGVNLYVADRGNNAIRFIDSAAGQTFTFTTQGISQPVGLAVDADDNVYVLNYGNGANGTVLKFDEYGDLIATNATGISNAAGIAVDGLGNIYLTVRSNQVLQITPAGVQSILITIPDAGTSLRGIVFRRDATLAMCDSGRQGIYNLDPISGVLTTNAGFHGVGDFVNNGNNVSSSSTAKFNQPYGITEAGDGTLVVADLGNHRVKVVLTTGVVTNLYGVSSNYWFGPLNPSLGVYPGWWDGTVAVPDSFSPVEARLPVGVVFAPDGSVYTTEIYYHLIRKVTGTGLPQPPPPPPQVPEPVIGWVDFPFPDFLSLLHPGTSFVFNNDVILAIQGTAGSQTFYTFGPTPTTGTIPDPSPINGSTPPDYANNLFSSQVQDLPITRYPDMLIKAIGAKNDGSPSSEVVQTRIQFVVANPVFQGDNAAMFSVSCLTSNSVIWYTTDGSNPTNVPPSIQLPSNPGTISLNITSNTTVKVRAFRDNYQPSQVVARTFSPTNFNANKITFGFLSGEASSDFVASPGQYFYSPVTLSVLPDTKIYSLQFNLTVTNAGPNPGPAVMPGAVGFESFLEKPDPANLGYYKIIPPLSFAGYQSDPPPASSLVNYDGGAFVDMTFVNTNNNLNLMGVGWLERFGETNLYNTKAQDLIKYSQPHDTMFLEDNGRVVVGGYAFRVPGTAVGGQTYQIQIGLPTATSDGVGAPGSDVYIAAPTNGSFSAIKIVTVGQRKYVAGDAAPFRWFNAGDFGNGNLANDDVMQVFQSAIYGLNQPPFDEDSWNGIGYTNVSDFFDVMDSCGYAFTDNGNGYLEIDSGAPYIGVGANPLFDGSDTNINQIAFGDGYLDVCDVYVTFRRSLDPTLCWFQRFWTNGIRAAESLCEQPAPAAPLPAAGAAASAASVNFASADFIASAGQTLQIPITAQIAGTYPIKVLMLNLTVTPLDGSPALTSAIQFAANPALGPASITSSKGNGNYAATWLNSSITGLSGNATLGTLTVQIPAGANSSAAYAIRFEHASASPNGLASFPKKTQTGLVTLSDRSASSWNDGISDSWRLRYFGSINNWLSAPTADADGDGADNAYECKSGTDPNDAASVLRLRLNRESSQDFVIRWPSGFNKQYVVERSSSLSTPVWSAVSTNIGTGGDIEFHDTSGGPVTRFYRVRPLN